MVTDGKLLRMGASPFMENDRALVPLRAVAEALQAKADWQEDDRYGEKGRQNHALTGRKRQSGGGRGRKALGMVRRGSGEAGSLRRCALSVKAWAPE